MKFRISEDELSRTAFTLIELLVVIAIIAVLAALVIPGSRLAAAARTKSRARAELRQVESFIELYKISSNFYPPCSPINDPKMNCLYYELVGTRQSNGVYTTLNGAAQINSGDIHIAFLLDGFANAAQGAADDNVRQPKDFVSRSLRVGQFLEVFVTNAPLSASARVVILGSLLPGGDMLPGASGGRINPFGYNSASPSHNPNSFDLWLDVLVGGVTNRICNWSDKPIRL